MGLRKTKRTEKTCNASLPWSQADVKYLVINYPACHDKDLAVTCGRSEDAIRGMARRLGLKKDYAGGYKPCNSVRTGWATKEINRLRRLYPTTSNHDIAEILGRSFASVKGQAKELKLRKMEFWTDEETEFLNTHYPKMSIAKLAEQLGRTEGAVMSQIHRLGLEHRVKPWTDADFKQLKKYYHKMDGRAIAQLLGRSYGAVRRKANLLGLAENRCWSEQENRTLKECYYQSSLEEVAEQVGRTPCAVKKHAQFIGLHKSIQHFS